MTLSVSQSVTQWVSESSFDFSDNDTTITTSQLIKSCKNRNATNIHGRKYPTIPIAQHRISLATFSNYLWQLRKLSQESTQLCLGCQGSGVCRAIQLQIGLVDPNGTKLGLSACWDRNFLLCLLNEQDRLLMLLLLMLMKLCEQNSNVKVKI